MAIVTYFIVYCERYCLQFSIPQFVLFETFYNYIKLYNYTKLPFLIILYYDRRDYLEFR